MLTIWLMPAQETAAKLSELIYNLSQAHQTANFDPHITLLSGITESEQSAKQKLAQMGKNLAPITASLTSVEYLELYYKCLFFNTSQSEPLLRARGLAEQLFEHTQIQPFIPHVSFLYGELPVFKKQEIIGGLDPKFFQGIVLDKIRLVRTQRAVEDWELLLELDLR